MSCLSLGGLTLSQRDLFPHSGPATGPARDTAESIRESSGGRQPTPDIPQPSGASDTIKSCDYHAHGADYETESVGSFLGHPGEHTELRAHLTASPLLWVMIWGPGEAQRHRGLQKVVRAGAGGP